MTYSREALSDSKHVACRLRNFGIQKPGLTTSLAEFISTVTSDPFYSALTMYLCHDETGRRANNLLIAVSPLETPVWGLRLNQEWVDKQQTLQALHRQLRREVEPDLLSSLVTPRPGELQSVEQAAQRISPEGIYRAWPYTTYELLSFLDLRPAHSN